MDKDEKNRQVPMMSQIYGKARGVCVWIGPKDKYSEVAFKFIREDVLRLAHFDELCNDQSASKKWDAIYQIMKREWFSRRRVVQEIALAKKATIHCGEDKIPWKDFADAVQLFVEVETATHRLSEVMRKDESFYHVPMWFEYVSALGASLLVDATGTLFRKTRDDSDQQAQPLLRLEHLVSRMTIFKASVPHDVIYSLLAISKDARPVAFRRNSPQTMIERQLGALEAKHSNKRPFPVDYRKHIIDVCKDFIAFCVRDSEPTRALDIICRPWDPVHEPGRQREGAHSGEKPAKRTPDVDQFTQMPSWIPTLEGAAFSMYIQANGDNRMARQSADPLVGLADSSQRNYNAAQTKHLQLGQIRFKKYDKQYSMFVDGFVCDKVARVERSSQSGNIPKEWISMGGWDDLQKDPPDDLWRTLVADRGPNGRNPPTYYARACKESIDKGLSSGALNTEKLISEGRCFVIAEFFRRVQAVIWNRALMRTEKGNALGIVGKEVRRGDLVCVLYGCSVPVIVRPHEKTDDEVQYEETEWKRDCQKYAALVGNNWKNFAKRKSLKVEEVKEVFVWDKDKGEKGEWVFTPKPRPEKTDTGAPNAEPSPRPNGEHKVADSIGHASKSHAPPFSQPGSGVAPGQYYFGTDPQRNKPTEDTGTSSLVNAMCTALWMVRLSGNRMKK